MSDTELTHPHSQTHPVEATDTQGHTLKRIGIGVAVVALLVVGAGIASRMHATNELAAVAENAAVPTVTVIAAQKNQGGGDLVLPGTIQAFNSAEINARTNGYVRAWKADIGDKVSTGQTLAILDAPDVDQQLARARAEYGTALANQKLAATTSKRWQSLLKQDAVSQQEADEKAGDLAAKTAVTNASLANVRQLQATQGFNRLTAPFNGVVTSRSAQIGALVVAGNASAQPLFTVSDIHRMRIYVQIPQSYSAEVHPGLTANLSVPEFPGRDFAAVLVRSSGAVDQKSGAMLVELQADNADGALKPGAFAHVRFTIAGLGGGLRLPGSAILYGAQGPSVAVVGKDRRVTIKPVKIARDEGKTVLVSVGVIPGDKVIDSPPDSIQTGDKVQIAVPDKAGKANG